MATRKADLAKAVAQAVERRKRDLALTEELWKSLGGGGLRNASRSIDTLPPLAQVPLLIHFTLYEGDVRLREAFAKNGLDPRQLGHWRILLDALVEVTNPSDGGRSEEWTDERLAELALDLRQVIASTGAASQAELARRIKKQFPSKYEKLERHRVGQALRFTDNPYLLIRENPRLLWTLTVEQIAKNVAARNEQAAGKPLQEFLADVAVTQAIREVAIPWLRQHYPKQSEGLTDDEVLKKFGPFIDEAIALSRNHPFGKLLSGTISHQP